MSGPACFYLLAPPAAALPCTRLLRLPESTVTRLLLLPERGVDGKEFVHVVRRHQALARNDVLVAMLWVVFTDILHWVTTPNLASLKETEREGRGSEMRGKLSDDKGSVFYMPSKKLPENENG